MQSTIEIYKKVVFKNPILIEGLPGIGFVANICAAHLINSLKAEKFGEIYSPHFQDLAITTEEGTVRTPINELYYWKSPKDQPDLIILYGNTQALSVQGQYEICDKIIAYAKDMGCKLIITIGGLKKDKVSSYPQLYVTATDFEILNQVRNYGLDILQGHIYGAAGLLLGLAKLRGVKGFCILTETMGTYPDAAAAKAVLELLDKILELKISLDKLEKAVEETSKILETFKPIETKRSEEFLGLV